ncbi:hypothetical protein M378DRAFT_170534 [Amanita muscaria Koide BX008]|uniref:Uncharacterized protein n=1 Tax=Amanita muscaria (strain Koide BX008) TaxID=946122 RepID=A0A0C2S738_AMAMK|nr:hypothetical protein M378DRAFT_170534 [Amanita muscaria Koide BX008]
MAMYLILDGLPGMSDTKNIRISTVCGSCSPGYLTSCISISPLSNATFRGLVECIPRFA